MAEFSNLRPAMGAVLGVGTNRRFVILTLGHVVSDWAIPKHVGSPLSCPLCARQRRESGHCGRSELCRHERTHAPQQYRLCSIKSSARARRESGTVMPSAFAVLRLITVQFSSAAQPEDRPAWHPSKSYQRKRTLTVYVRDARPLRREAAPRRLFTECLRTFEVDNQLELAARAARRS
jgi:hypothetical protein